MAILERTGNGLFGGLKGGLKGLALAAIVGAAIVVGITLLLGGGIPLALGLGVGGAIGGAYVGGPLFSGIGAIFGGAKGFTKPTREQQTASLQAQLAQSRAQGAQNCAGVGSNINYRGDWAAKTAAEQQAIAQGNAR